MFITSCKSVSLSFCLLRESINSGTQVYAIFQSFRSIAIDMRYLAYQIAVIVLGTSSLFFCYLLMQSKLILTVLAVQGLVGYLFLLLSAILDIFVIVDTIRGIGLIMYLPYDFRELIAFPAWLFIKGFKLKPVEYKVKVEKNSIFMKIDLFSS